MLKKLFFLLLGCISIFVQGGSKTENQSFVEIRDFMKSHSLSEKVILDQNQCFQFLEGIFYQIDPEGSLQKEFDVNSFKKRNWSLVCDSIESGDFDQIAKLYLKIQNLFLVKLESYGDDLDSYLVTSRSKVFYLDALLEKHNLLKSDLRTPAVLKNEIDHFKRKLLLVKGERLFTNIVNIYLSLYDPHSHFYGLGQVQNLMELSSGKILGLGLQVVKKGEMFFISGVVEGTSAASSPYIQKGYYLTHIGLAPDKLTSLSGKSILDLKELMSAYPGKSLFVAIFDPKKNKNDHKINIVELKTSVYSVKGKELNLYDISINNQKEGGHFKVIGISKFYRSEKDVKNLYRQYFKEIKKVHSMADFKNMGKKSRKRSYVELSQKYSSLVLSVTAELEKIQKSGEKFQGIIIDLRGNLGGSLAEAINLAGLFLSREIIVKEYSRFRDQMNIYQSQSSHLVYRGPLLVLVDQNTASSAEIFAAAIQDYKRGPIVGVQTWGKGSAQQRQMFETGLLAYTTAQLYRASGKSTQLKGVTPDIILLKNKSSRSFRQAAESRLLNHMSYKDIGSEEELFSYLDLEAILPSLRKRSLDRYLSNEKIKGQVSEAVFMNEVSMIFNDAIMFEYSQMEVSKHNLFFKSKLMPSFGQWGNAY